QAVVNLLLHVGGHPQGDVPEGRGRQLRIEQVLVFLVGELEERERAPVPETEERVAVHPLGTEQLVGFGPRGHQGKPDQVLVEGTRRLLVLRDIGVVVQSARKILCGHDPSLRWDATLDAHYTDILPYTGHADLV